MQYSLVERFSGRVTEHGANAPVVQLVGGVGDEDEDDLVSNKAPMEEDFIRKAVSGVWARLQSATPP